MSHYVRFSALFFLFTSFNFCNPPAHAQEENASLLLRVGQRRRIPAGRVGAVTLPANPFCRLERDPLGGGLFLVGRSPGQTFFTIDSLRSPERRRIAVVVEVPKRRSVSASSKGKKSPIVPFLQLPGWEPAGTP